MLVAMMDKVTHNCIRDEHSSTVEMMYNVDNHLSDDECDGDSDASVAEGGAVQGGKSKKITVRSKNHGGKGGNDEDDDSKIFPQRLMEILSDEENQCAIGWLPHGRAFVIKSRKLFSELVMPKYFSRKAKYSSFTRKLNRWNFIRVSSGAEMVCWVSFVDVLSLCFMKLTPKCLSLSTGKLLSRVLFARQTSLCSADVLQECAFKTRHGK
jgi:HSF-type DNA-binding